MCGLREKEKELIWKDELEAIDQLSRRVANLGSDISRQMTQLESRRDTIQNELVKLDADYAVLVSRNEEEKKEFQKSRRLDLEQFEESKRRVLARELVIIEKEKELRRMQAELEIAIASAKSAKNQMESLGRNHVKK